MALPLFPKWANSVLWLAIGVAIASGVVLFVTLFVSVRSPYFTAQSDTPTQPVKFDHRHHVHDDGVACLYCHGSAVSSPFAGVPATSTCMGCHNQIWTTSPEVAPVRESYFQNKPIRWRRVNNLPDFVFFNHSIHLAKGVGCVTCHGRVDLMPEVAQAQPLLMSWCLDCHREPEKHLRPREHVTDMDYQPDRPQPELGRELVRKYDVHPTTDCTGCHR